MIKAYQDNGNKRVSLVVHSMGGPMALMWLHRQTQLFKDKYIESLISLSGAFAGSVLAVSIFIQGKSVNLVYRYIVNRFRILFPTHTYSFKLNKKMHKKMTLKISNQRC